MGPAEGEFGRRRRRGRRAGHCRAVRVNGDPDWRCGWRRSRRLLILRDRDFALAGWTLELVAAPELVARDFLLAVGAEEFDFSHNVRLLIASFQFLRPGVGSQRGREFRPYLQHRAEFASRKCASVGRTGLVSFTRGRQEIHLALVEACLRAWAMILSSSTSKAKVSRSNVSRVGLWTSCST